MSAKNELEKLSDIELLALCIWSEARGEPLKGQVAVAHVVLNRIRGNEWFGETVSGVILKRYQFSWFNEPPAKLPKVGKEFLTMASMVEAGFTKDVSRGATHFHADWLEPAPFWAAEMKRTTTIGAHIFYK